jgi:hypothetical protein
MVREIGIGNNRCFELLKVDPIRSEAVFGSHLQPPSLEMQAEPLTETTQIEKNGLDASIRAVLHKAQRFIVSRVSPLPVLHATGATNYFVPAISSQDRHSFIIDASRCSPNLGF